MRLLWFLFVFFSRGANLWPIKSLIKTDDDVADQAFFFDFDFTIVVVVVVSAVAVFVPKHDDGVGAGKFS